MKLASIGPDRIYWDGKQGVRAVLRECAGSSGSIMIDYAMMTSGGRPESYPGASAAPVFSMGKTSFAQWAKIELVGPEIELVYDHIVIEKIGFTAAQKAFLATLDGATTQTLVECENSELRVARNLARMGMISIDHFKDGLGFQVTPTRIGMVALEHLSGHNFRERFSHRDREEHLANEDRGVPLPGPGA